MSNGAAGLAALVLGSAAGGGVPQWNCACRICSLAREGSPRVRPATQASIAVSADCTRWLLIGASPDLRQQIADNAVLHPHAGARDSPIAAVVLISADVDGIAGLLTLRERQAFTLYAPASILETLRENGIFDVLDPAFVARVEIVPMQPIETGLGLTLTLLPMPGKTPLYLEQAGATDPEPGPAYAALVQANGRSVIVAPACTEITAELHARFATADLLFFDGTLFTDDEMQRAGVGQKTGRRMGHMPISGPDGSLARLADIPARRVYFHINNTNPVLCIDAPERNMVTAAGFEIAQDGMEIRL